MITSIMTILYILTVSNESINNGTLQKGTAVSRVGDDDDGLQVYKYFNYLTSDSSDSIEPTPLKEENIYLVTGKFATAQDDSINIRIISNVHLPLDKNDIPIMKPTVHLLGKIMNPAQLTEAGYTLQIQVKPYLSKEQFNPFLVNLTHPADGRLKNAVTMAKKSSTVHVTGLFFIVDKRLYCEMLEFQFVTASKMESENTTISVPWKSKTDSTTSSSKPKSAIERRIDLIRQDLDTKTPPKSSANSSQIHKKQKKAQDQHVVKIDDDDDDDDDDDEIDNNEEIDNDNKNIKENNEKDDVPANVRRSKRKIDNKNIEENNEKDDIPAKVKKSKKTKKQN